jgi:HlyD family secretion protein
MTNLKFLSGRNPWYLGIALAVIFTAVMVLPRVNSANASKATDTSARVVSLDLAETVEASGSLEAQPSASLAWNTSGIVEATYAEAGDRVREGEVLMKLRTTSVSSSIISAQAELATAQKELDDLLSSSDTDLAQAVIDLKDAREEYEKAVNYLEYLERSQKVPQTQTKVFIESKRNSWRYVYKTKTFKGPAPQDWIVEAENDLALKKAEYEDAQLAYDRLKDGPNARDLLAAQANVDAAQATVDSMSIISPFDGEVLYVESQPGDVVDANTLAVHIADLDHLFIETQVDELDIAKVERGDPIIATLDALPGVTLTGSVTAINPVGEEVSGLVKYTVRVDLDPVAAVATLPLGATTSVTIQVQEASAALAVPITTIQNDANGEFVMVLQNDGTLKRVDVVSGTILDELVVVRGDLLEGDRVQVSNGSSFEAPNPFGGGQE